MSSMLEYIIRDLVQSLSTSINLKENARLIEKEINSYVENLYDKLRLTKNILFRNKPINFYDNYIPLKLRLDDRIVSTRNPLDFIEHDRKITILGSAGSGKTTLLKFIALKCIDEGFKIPIFLELRNYNEDKLSFENFVSKNISEVINANELFSSGRFVFILDGFDEINFYEGMDVISQIERFISKYTNNLFIISSRHGTNIESLSQFYVYEIESLNFEDISLFIKKLDLSNKTRNGIYEYLEKNEMFSQYLTNPLFLSLYINYVNYHAFSDMPSKKTVFFRNILDTLFSQHDSVSKLGFIRNKLSGLTKDELENVSSILAFRALISSSKSFSTDRLYNELQLIRQNTDLFFENENIIYDLTITVNVLINDSGYYSFTHIVFLEYLASLFISRLTVRKKEKVYQQFIDTNKVFYSITFLSFLYELDYQSFIQFFIIPYIQKIFEKPESLNENSRNTVIEFLMETYKKNKSRHYDEYMVRYELDEIFIQLKNEIRTNEDDDGDELLKF